MPPRTFQCIPADQAAVLIQSEANITVFDVRDMASYRLAHLAEAAHLAEDRLPAWLCRLPKDQAIVIYCYKGKSSQNYAQTFADFHFSRVYSVDGGYEALALALAKQE